MKRIELGQYIVAESPFVVLTMGDLPQYTYWYQSLPNERIRMDLNR